MHGSGGLEFNHFWLDVTKTSKTSITSGFCTDVTLDVHFQGATLHVMPWNRFLFHLSGTNKINFHKNAQLTGAAGKKKCTFATRRAAHLRLNWLQAAAQATLCQWQLAIPRNAALHRAAGGGARCLHCSSRVPRQKLLHDRECPCARLYPFVALRRLRCCCRRRCLASSHILAAATRA